MFTTAIIPAAGSGRRFGEKKQFKVINGEPLIFHTLKPFVESKVIDEIIIASSDESIDQVNKILISLNSQKNIKVVTGSSSRQSSVKNAIDSMSEKTELICIHDAVRPFVTKKLIKKIITNLNDNDALVVAKRSTDTLKIIADSVIKKTINREEVWSVQTPQVFKRKALINAYSKALKENFTGTDDATLVEKAGYKVKILEDISINIKITNKEDWTIAEALFSLKNNV